MKNTILSVLFLCLSAVSLGISERGYEATYQAKVAPHLRSAITGTFRGQDKVQIAYAISRAEDPKGKIVIAPGFSESYLNYAELIYDLNQRGYSVYIVDHRGQGLSGRMVANTQIIHVDEFHFYVDDMETFIRTHVKPDQRELPMYLLGNSMGGWIASQLLARQPKWFKGATLIAPMFRINTGNIPRFLALRIAGTADGLGRGKRFALGYGEIDIAKSTFNPEEWGSRVRWKQNLATEVANPRLIHGGPSYRWVRLGLRYTAKWRIRRLAKKISTPHLVLQAGQDTAVKPGGIDLFCEYSKGCTRVNYPDAHHGILKETDSIRSHALNKILTFFEAQ